MNITKTGLASLFLVLGGCVTVNSSVLSDARTNRPVPLQAVQVYFADDSVPDHERIAILNAKGPEHWTNEGQMIDKLREEAGKLGANAIILNQLRDPDTGERVIAALFGGAAQRRGEALAIFVSEGNQRQRAQLIYLERSSPPRTGLHGHWRMAGW